MPRAELAQAVQEIVIAHSRMRPTHIEDGVTLGADLGFDSLAFLLTISDLETRLGFSFPLERAHELVDISLGGLVDLVAREGGRSVRPPGVNKIGHA
jgi:acyl carrier protein